MAIYVMKHVLIILMLYVGDVNNHRIRKIALEKIPEATEEHPEESQPEEGEQ